jgi:hypothetical protein
MAAFDFTRPRDETIPQLVDTPQHETKAASFNTIFTCEVALVLASRWRGWNESSPLLPNSGSAYTWAPSLSGAKTQFVGRVRLEQI